jgi:hypothetical protein
LFAIWGGAFVVIGLYFIVGRFFVKAHRKRTSVYAVTDRRAFITNGRRTTELDPHSGDRTTTWSRDRQHVSVVWNMQRGGWGGLFGTQRSLWPGNSGMDVFSSSGSTGFYDVRDGQALLAALDHARSAGPR